MFLFYMRLSLYSFLSNISKYYLKGRTDDRCGYSAVSYRYIKPVGCYYESRIRDRSGNCPVLSYRYVKPAGC